MRLSDEAELTKLKMNFYRLINFILATTIITAGCLAVYHAGRVVISILG
jgi:hypothetical protein